MSEDSEAADDALMTGDEERGERRLEVLQANRAPCNWVVGMCGQLLLFGTLGFVLGGIIIRNGGGGGGGVVGGGGVGGGNSSSLGPRGVSWAADSACDLLLGSRVDSRLCAEHSADSSFARRLEGAGLNFLVVGDFGRDGHCCQRDVAAEMSLAALKTNAGFVVSTGDNFYPNGLKSAHDAQVSSSWSGVYDGAGLRDLDWFAVLGNHEYRGNAQAAVDLSAVHQRWRMPQRFYEQLFEGSGGVSAHVVFLDTTPMMPVDDTELPAVAAFLAKRKTTRRGYVKEQADFLRTTLENTTATWRIVVGHHPVFTSSEHYKEDHVTLREELAPVLEQVKAHAYLNGHDHALEVHRPQSFTTAFILSGAGSKVRPATVVRDEGFKFHHGASGGFTSISATKNTLLLQMIDAKGTLLLEDTITNSGN